MEREYIFIVLAVLIILLKFYDKFWIKVYPGTIGVLRPQLPYIAPIVSFFLFALFLVWTVDSFDGPIDKLVIFFILSLIFFVLLLLNLLCKPYLILNATQVILKSRFKRDRIFDEIKNLDINNYLFFYIIRIDNYHVFIFGKISLDVNNSSSCSYCNLVKIAQKI